MYTEDLLLYGEDAAGGTDAVLSDMARLKRMADGQEPYEKGEDRRLFFAVFRRLLDFASETGASGNLWQAYLAHYIAENENAYSLALEIGGAAEGSLNEIARHDFSFLRELFNWDFTELKGSLGTGQCAVMAAFTQDPGKTYSLQGDVVGRLEAFRSKLAAADGTQSFREAAAEYYKKYGVGKFGLHKAFRIGRGEGGRAAIVPIANILPASLDDLVGCETQKERLVANTEAFVEGRRANNCLLYGETGTGKSSSIKGILNRFAPAGLRMIQVYKYDFKDLMDIIAQIKLRRYRFILYMDDLSFEEDETEYKYLKAVIEGDLEQRPENVILYATSNRRHLVRENYRDKEDRYQDMHTSDTVQEKLSLAERFGLRIYYGSPDRQGYEEIVRSIAKKSGLDMPEEELLAAANIFEITHGGFSGRVARQFVDEIAGRQK